MPDNDAFLAKLHDAVLGGRVLREGCAPMPRYAELDAEARADAAELLSPVARATLRLLLEMPVADPLLDALSAEWARRRVGAFVRQHLGGEGRGATVTMVERDAATLDAQDSAAAGDAPGGAAGEEE